MEKQGVNLLLNGAIESFLKDALRVVAKNPSMSGFLLRAAAHQKKAERLRSDLDKEGVRVPPYMIISVTNSCNLSCKGCYSRAQHRREGDEMSFERLRALISEAGELGVSFIFFAGGEPLMRPEILDAAGDFPEIIFPLFTNGLLITDDIAEKFARIKNVVPVLSIEGRKEETDGRRGEGVHDRVGETLGKLRGRGVFYGVSFTVTSENFKTLTDEAYISGLVESGCRLFFFVEYVPVRENTENLVISDGQRSELSLKLESFRSKFPGLFISFPGDEEQFGGCLSAGRGFIHISAEGNLEPCPFAPYSDQNLKGTSLKEALRSELLARIRENGAALSETHGGCALWEKREWVKSLVK